MGWYGIYPPHDIMSATFRKGMNNDAGEQLPRFDLLF